MMQTMHHCPGCAEALWDDNPPHEPRPGMIIVCAYCGQAIRLGPLLEFHAIEPEQIKDLEQRARIVFMRTIARLGMGAELINQEAQRRGMPAPGRKVPKP